MSSFTAPLTVTALPAPARGAARLLPPGFQRPRWRVRSGFDYAVGSLDNPSEIVTVPGGYVFDGASVPLPFRAIVPMAHPNYMQAAALHDWMLTTGRYPRAFSDRVFHEALDVLGMPPVWRVALYGAVRIGAVWWHVRRVTRGATNAS